MTAGQLFLITNGEYDDYGVSALMRASRDFDLRAVTIKYREIYGDPRRDHGEAFPAFLASEGLAENLDYEEVGFSAYDQVRKSLYCQHERRTWKSYSSLKPEHEPFGSIAQCCDCCNEMFPDTARPATEEEYFAVYPHMRNPETGHRYTDEEYRAAHPEYYSK